MIRQTSLTRIVIAWVGQEDKLETVVISRLSASDFAPSLSDTIIVDELFASHELPFWYTDS